MLSAIDPYKYDISSPNDPDLSDLELYCWQYWEDAEEE